MIWWECCICCSNCWLAGVASTSNDYNSVADHLSLCLSVCLSLSLSLSLSLCLVCESCTAVVDHWTWCFKTLSSTKSQCEQNTLNILHASVGIQHEMVTLWTTFLSCRKSWTINYLNQFLLTGNCGVLNSNQIKSNLFAINKVHNINSS